MSFEAENRPHSSSHTCDFSRIKVMPARNLDHEFIKLFFYTVDSRSFTSW